MKKIFPLLFLLAFYTTASAQLIVYSEPFDGFSSYIITGWHYEFTGMVPWECGLPEQVGGCMLPSYGPMSRDNGTNKVACIPDCGLWNPNDSNVFSYTPRIDMSSVSGAWLKYDSYFSHYTDGTDTEKATVEFSIDSGNTFTVIQTNPVSSPYGTFTTQYINISAYDHVYDLRIGFRYTDGGHGGHMQGWAIDNVTVFVPARKDLSLLSVTPGDTLLSYVKTGYGYSHQATIFNAGLDTVHTFVLNYRQESGPIVSDTITGVTLLPFSTTTFTHNIGDTVLALGTFKVDMWVTLDSDAYHYNDTAHTWLRGTTFYPTKKLAIESGEGTYNGWSPRNMYYLSSIAGHDVEACLISVHENDPMEDTPYHDFMFNLGWNYVPYILFDRRTNVPLDSFFQYLDVEKLFFGFANISLNGVFEGNTLTVNTNITPAIDLHGDYRLALVITEDGGKGTGSNYDQYNNYAGGGKGPMGGYETRPNPVPATQMVYNYVARQIYPSPEGASGLPSDMLNGNTYNYSLTTTIDPAYLGRHLKAIVMLIRHDDSVVLNSNQLPFYLKTPTPDMALQEAGVYPNPANDQAKVYFDIGHDEKVNISLSDISGKVLYQYPKTNFTAGRNYIQMPLQGLSTGIYIVTLRSEDGSKSLKLEVVH